MTSYSFGDVVLVPFPFTDQTGSKKRPAVVVSSAAYNNSRPDLILMAITSQVKTSQVVGDMVIGEWKQAGLLKASIIKPVLLTIEKRLVRRQLGKLQLTDNTALRQVLQVILG